MPWCSVGFCDPRKAICRRRIDVACPNASSAACRPEPDRCWRFDIPSSPPTSSCTLSRPLSQQLGRPTKQLCCWGNDGSGQAVTTDADPRVASIRPDKERRVCPPTTLIAQGVSLGAGDDCTHAANPTSCPDKAVKPSGRALFSAPRRQVSVTQDCSVRFYHLPLDERRFKLDDDEWVPSPRWVRRLAPRVVYWPVGRLLATVQPHRVDNHLHRLSPFSYLLGPFARMSCHRSMQLSIKNTTPLTRSWGLLPIGECNGVPD